MHVGRDIMKRVLVTGGAGYVGHRLVPRLLDAGYAVVVYDAMYFPNRLKWQPNLTVVEGDIRDTKRLAEWFPVCHDVIHLACISNDPSFELDESLSRTINFECFEPMVIAAKQAGIERFIYASTSSVYGISDSPNVTEDHPLVPITLYNKYKGMCEPLLFKHCGDGFVGTVLRPSTICGYSERQRLDLAVNILTNLAYSTGKIIVHGGAQMRPNLHIEDMVDCYLCMLKAPYLVIQRETFNVGQRNYTIMELAVIVAGVVQEEFPFLGPIQIERTATVDARSYQVNSDKIKRVLDFEPKRTIEDAIRDLCDAFKAGKLPDSMTDDRYVNVARMHKVWADVYKNASGSAFDPTKGHLSEIDVMHR